MPIGKVVDFGAGDGRFALAGRFDQYIGFEVAARPIPQTLPKGAVIVGDCAFASEVSDADLCIGNPPYVRNQSLPRGWRQLAADTVRSRIGVELSGLANAWQYFLSLSLASVKEDGLVALVIPYEWVSRPAARHLRDHVRERRYNVAVHRLRDETFRGVLTTSSITIIDKSRRDGTWAYLSEEEDGGFSFLPSTTPSTCGHIEYAGGSCSTYARRGLSPGSQRALVLTEGGRVRNGLEVGRDVVACVTSLRHLEECDELSGEEFETSFRQAARKCWLVRTDTNPSNRLRAYLESVPEAERSTATCSGRETWWRFQMPRVPDLLVAQGFREGRPKIIGNTVGARAVGGVAGIYCGPKERRPDLLSRFRELELTDRVVPHSWGFRKVEISQLNALITNMVEGASGIA